MLQRKLIPIVLLYLSDWYKRNLLVAMAAGVKCCNPADYQGWSEVACVSHPLSPSLLAQCFRFAGDEFGLIRY